MIREFESNFICKEDKANQISFYKYWNRRKFYAITIKASTKYLILKFISLIREDSKS